MELPVTFEIASSFKKVLKMSGQARLYLGRLNLENFTHDEARQIIAGIQGVVLADLNFDKREAMIVINTCKSSPETVIENILKAGLTFKRFSFADMQIE